LYFGLIVIYLGLSELSFFCSFFALCSQSFSSQDQNMKNVSARSSNAKCKNMMAEHEEVLAAKLVMTTKHQDTTRW